MAEIHFVGSAFLIAKAREAATLAVNQAAEDLVGRAQAAAPVDTGTLRASIHTDGAQATGDGAQARVQTGGESSGYAIFQHEGTSRGVPATKFLERPLLEMAPVYQAFMQAAMRSAF